jgi:hypothetical protein
MNNPAVAQEELPATEPVEQDNRSGTAWHARYMQRQKDGTPNTYELRMQANANLPNQGVNTQSDPMNQSGSVDNAYTQADAFPPLENQIPLYTFQVYIWVNLKTLTRQLDESTHSTTSTMMKFCQLTKSLPTQVGKDEDPLEKERTMEKELLTPKNTGITPELPTKEKARTMPTGISIIPSFRNSEQPKALLSSHLKTSCNQSWFTHANQLDLSREASAQAMRYNQSASRKYDRAQTLDQRL